MLHMALAKDAASTLGDRPPIADLGAYYLGATTPDIRVLTRWERERTHFYRLDRFDHQNSVERLFEAYPELALPEKLNPSTVAFVAGYITHLRMDELYIEAVYRPHFGARSSLRDNRLGNLMDRVLQYELDRRRREQPEVVAHVSEELRRSSLDIKVAFLDAETLARWRDVSIDLAVHPPDWAGFRRVASRHLKEAGIDSEEDLESFLKDVPRLLDETIRHVRADRIDEFLERSLNATAGTIAEYLDCA